MHFVAYVLLPKAKATTSLEARLQVYWELVTDPSFMGGKGRFFMPICDQFEIGGSFSGWLYPEPLRKKFFHQADKLTEEDEPGWSRNEVINHHREELDAIWHKLGGANASPLTRNPNRKGGEEDDARLLDQLLAELLNTFLHDTRRYSADSYLITISELGLVPIVISLDEQLNLYSLEDFNNLSGQYWVVVIAYQR